MVVVVVQTGARGCIGIERDIANRPKRRCKGSGELVRKLIHESEMGVAGVRQDDVVVIGACRARCGRRCWRGYQCLME